MVAPEVLVVVELRLGGGGVLPAEHPHLPAAGRRHHRLVRAPRRRTPGGDDL